MISKHLVLSILISSTLAVAGAVHLVNYTRFEEISNVPNILSLNYSCTAWVIKKNLIATAKHCVMGMQERNALSLGVFTDGYSTNFKIINQGEELDHRDWAILEGDTRNLIPFDLATEAPEFDSNCWHAGYGGGSAVQHKMPCSFGQEALGGFFTLHSVAIPGDSGSPVVDEETGRVIGLVVRTGYPIPVTYVVPYTELKRALSASGKGK
jgi:V8-like Glu-specific endopeptidase